MNPINRLDLKQLRVLQALLRERNLSRVAAQMGLTQQAISEQLRKLRDTFDDRLFIRASNGVTPTPLAEQLEGRINHILDEVERLLEPEAFDPASLNGLFTLSATDYAVQVILPPLLALLRARAPELKIVVRDFEADYLHGLLASGELDLALTFPAFTPDSCQTMQLFCEHHICVAGNDSELHNTPLTTAEVAALPQLVVSPSRANLRGSADDWFAAQGLARNIVMSVPSFAAAPDCVASSDCVAFLPSRILPHPKVKPLDTEAMPPCFELIAAWHPRSSNDPLHNWVLSLLREVFPEEEKFSISR